MLWAEKLAAVLVCLGWMVQGDNKQFSDSPLGFSFLPPSPCPPPHAPPCVFILLRLTEDEDMPLSDQGNSSSTKRTSLSQGISVSDLGERHESKVNPDEEEDEESLEKIMFQSNQAFQCFGTSPLLAEVGRPFNAFSPSSMKCILSAF